MSISKLGTLVAAKQTVTDLSQLSPRGMAKGAANNSLNIYSPPGLDEEEEEEEKFPTGGLLGAGLVGGGAMALPYMLGSDAKFDAAGKGIDDFLQDTSPVPPVMSLGPPGPSHPGPPNQPPPSDPKWQYPNMPKHTTVLTAYQDAMSRASALNPLGVPIGDILARSRTSQKLMDAVGMPTYTAKTPRSYLAAKKHYRQFRSGPIPAWYHQVGIKGAKLPGEGPATGTMYADYMLPKFREFWRGKGWGELMPSEIDASVMPLDDQAKLMREFHASLSPAEQTEKVRVESSVWGPGTEGNVKNYKGLMDKGHEVRDQMKTVGKYVGGAAGIYALYRLYKYMSAKKKKKEEEEEGGERQLRKAAGEPKGLGRIGKLLQPDVPTPKPKLKPKPKVTPHKPDIAPNAPLKTPPPVDLAPGHVATPGAPSQFGSPEQKRLFKVEQAKVEALLSSPGAIERFSGIESPFKDLEGLSPLARRHQQKQYGELLQKYYDLTGQPGPVVMPGHPAFEYPSHVPNSPSRIPGGDPVVPGRKIQGTTPRQAAKKGQTSS